MHQSAKDYLLRNEIDQDTTLKLFRLKLEEAHLALTLQCLKCVEQTALQHELVDVTELSEPVPHSLTLPHHT